MTKKYNTYAILFFATSVKVYLVGRELFAMDKLKKMYSRLKLIKSLFNEALIYRHNSKLNETIIEIHNGFLIP